MLPGKEHWLPAVEAARLADTDISNFRKLVRAGKLQADCIQIGKICKPGHVPEDTMLERLAAFYGLSLTGN